MKQKKMVKLLSGMLCAAMVTGSPAAQVSAAEFFDDGTELVTEIDGAEQGTIPKAECSPEQIEIPETEAPSEEESEESVFSSGAENEFCAPEEEAPEFGTDEEVFAAEAATSGTIKGTKLNWKFENGVLTVSGKGAIPSFYVIKDWETGEVIEDGASPWEPLSDRIKEIRVLDGVTEIGSSAFEHCENCEKVTIAGSVKRIREFSFDYCYALKDINIEYGVEVIEDWAFNRCGATELTLPASIGDGGDKTERVGLGGMLWIENVYVEGTSPTGLTSIDGVLFLNNGKDLVFYPTGRMDETYTIPSSVKTIRTEAFYYCKLKELTIPDNVTLLNEYSFFECTELEKITFSKNIKKIPKDVCGWNYKLNTVILPEGIQEIAYSAFGGCPELKTVKLPSTLRRLEIGAFDSQVSFTMDKPIANLHQLPTGHYITAVDVNVRALDDYKKAFQVLALVNKERKKVGAPALVMDPGLLETAMLRAAETYLYFEHNRPSQTGCFSANLDMRAENIAYGSITASGTMNQWMNSAGHKANILDKDNKSIGIGCVQIGDNCYWTQCFGGEKKKSVSASSYKNKTVNHKILVDPTYKEAYKAEFEFDATSIKVGETSKLYVYWDDKILVNSGVHMKSSNSAVCKVVNGTLRGVAPGTAKISIYFGDSDAFAVTKKITVKGPTKKVTSLSLQRRTLKLSVGKAYTLKATIKPTDATNKSLTWTSSNTKVATVKNGRVTAKAPGTAIITVKTRDGSNKRYTCKVTVVK